MYLKIIIIGFYFIFQTFILIPFLERKLSKRNQDVVVNIIKYMVCGILFFLICFLVGVGGKKESCGETFTHNGDNKYICTSYTDKEIINNRILQSLVFSIGLVMISNYSIDFCSELMKLKNNKE